MPADQEARLRELLLRLPLAERAPWMEEVERLERLVTAYEAITPKRRYDPQAEAYRFVPEVLALCREAGCLNPVIVAREPHRAKPPSPHTLARWLKEYRQQGLSCFLRAAHTVPAGRQDRRQAVISTAAVEWINQNWRSFHSPRLLYCTRRKHRVHI